MTISILFGICALAIVAPYLLRSAPAVFRVAAGLSTVILGLSAYIAVPVIIGEPLLSAGGLWYVDPFAGMLLLLIAFLQWSAVLVSVTYLTRELHEKAVDFTHVQRYFTLLFAFVLSMMLSVVSNNLGFMWVALEATTLTTTLLVAFYRQKGSLEAAWKYIVLCSTGISLGLVGLLLTFHAGSGAAELGLISLNWTHLKDVAPALDPSIMQIAFVFILIGYGTKVGLVPMHAWLPDAHSRAPAPISALLSGVLLNAALFSILRYKTLVDVSLGTPDWSGQLLLFFGALSCVVPAAFILVQTDYKRLLAYSSIEHMGLTAFLFGLGPVGTFAALVHMIGHALSKSMLFFAAGNIYLAFKSTKFEKVGEVMRVLPYTGAIFLAGVLALLAVPPSPLFLSEYRLFAGAISQHPVLVIFIAIGLTVIAAGFMRLIAPLLYSHAPHAVREDVVHAETLNISHAAMALHLVLIGSIGVLLWTGQVSAIINHIASSL